MFKNFILAQRIRKRKDALRVGIGAPPASLSRREGHQRYPPLVPSEGQGGKVKVSR